MGHHLGERGRERLEDSVFPFVHVQSGSTGSRVHLNPVLVARGLDCGKSMGGSKEGDKEREDQQRIHLGRKHDHRRSKKQ